MKINIVAGLRYGDRLWTEEFVSSGQALSWGTVTAVLGVGGVTITDQVDASEDQLRSILEAWASRDEEFPPHWQSFPAGVQLTVVEIEQQILAAARAFDSALRSVPSGIRIPPFEFSTVGPNPAQQWPVMSWRLTDEDRTTFSDVLDQLDGVSQRRLSNQVSLPTPPWNKGRFAEITTDDRVRIQAAFESASAARVSTPFHLWAAAWESFERRQNSAAIIVLAAAIETALKAYLAALGDEIAQRLLADIPSPPASTLFKIANEESDLKLPTRFKRWLQELSETRNRAAHRPQAESPPRLQLARWFAVGEAILMRLNGDAPDERVGELIQISPDNDAFVTGTEAVVLRRSIEHQGQETYHLFLESGDTRRFESLGEPLKRQTIT